MGYYITVSDIDFTINKENFDNALKALKNWSDSNTLKEALEEYAWHGNIGEDENYHIDYYGGEKLSNQSEFLDAIAPYDNPGSSMRITGEDGLIWEYRFNGTTMEEVYADIDFTQSREILNALFKTKSFQEHLPLYMGIHPELDKRIDKTLKGT